MNVVQFGSDVTGDLATAEKKEWLITNGLGGYGSGTIAGSMTRGYHGLLMAAVTPPTDRRLMSVKLEESVRYQNKTYELTSNRWNGGAVSPKGYENIFQFALEGSVPTWTYKLGEAVLEKRIWMVYGKNTTYVSYTLQSAAEAVHLTCIALCNNRPLHNTGQLDWPQSVECLPDGVVVNSANPGASSLTLRMQDADFVKSTVQWKDFYLPAEQSRGLLDVDNHVQTATFQAAVQPGETLLFMASAEDTTSFDESALENRQRRDQELLDHWEKAANSAATSETPDWVKQFVLAADQFVVDRRIEEPDGNGGTKVVDGKSVIAGYHWFGDWGRDTMISLPGLTLVTGRADEARTILSTFSNFISQGMLPNNFPDSSGAPPGYNTIDATLWYFEAIRSYFQATGDKQLLGELYPKLQDIINKHVEGTGRYNIKLDPTDSLLYGGAEGVQLTWMDAKVNGKVITPRIGKPVEISVLWYNALKAMVNFAATLGHDSQTYQTMAAATLDGFQRFWNAEKGYCFDVLDGPFGHESLLRPNQLFAVSLPESPLTPAQQKGVVNSCTEHLLTPYGLRSLASFESGYIGVYTGDQFHRDSAYHQGTVWGWLIGPYVKAHWKVYRDVQAVRKLLDDLKENLLIAGVGSFSEIFDGDAPNVPKGCVAQAWSVAQTLEAYDFVLRQANEN